jgi:hypothetical protein
MKKILTIFGALLFCAIFVTAATYTNVEYLGASGDYKVTYDEVIKEGWNLLPADLGDWSITDYASEEEVLSKIKAYYVYFPVDNKYENALEGLYTVDEQQMASNEQYLKSSAAWYYVTGDLVLSYVAEDGAPMPELYKGWNLLSIGPALTVLNSEVVAADEFPTGNCDVQKIYAWDSETQSWIDGGNFGNMQTALDELAVVETVGAGIAIKVADSCQLGIGSQTVVSPPTLPA